MRLDGWNYIPKGYGLGWDLREAPLWLRFWFRTPFLDRFAYPVVIRRGFAWLNPHPWWREEDRERVPSGWCVEERIRADRVSLASLKGPPCCQKHGTTSRPC